MHMRTKLQGTSTRTQEKCTPLHDWKNVTPSPFAFEDKARHLRRSRADRPQAASGRQRRAASALYGVELPGSCTKKRMSMARLPGPPPPLPPPRPLPPPPPRYPPPPRGPPRGIAQAPPREGLAPNASTYSGVQRDSGLLRQLAPHPRSPPCSVPRAPSALSASAQIRRSQISESRSLRPARTYRGIENLRAYCFQTGQAPHPHHDG